MPATDCTPHLIASLARCSHAAQACSTVDEQERSGKGSSAGSSAGGGRWGGLILRSRTSKSQPLSQAVQQYLKDAAELHASIVALENLLASGQLDDEIVNYVTQCGTRLTCLGDLLHRQCVRALGHNPNLHEHATGILAVLTTRLGEATDSVAALKAAQQFRLKAQLMPHACRPDLCVVGDEGDASVLSGLSEEEVALLEQENADLLRDLKSDVDDAREVEKQIAEISHLQSVFASQVVEQEEQIDYIHTLSVESAHEIERGNSYLTKTLEQGLSTHQLVFLVLMALSAALLLLDWLL